MSETEETVAEQEWAWPELGVITEAWSQGVRARDWPMDGLSKILGNASDHWQRYLLHLVAYYHALDTRRYSEAQKQIEDAIWQARRWTWPEGGPLTLLLLEQLYLEAYLRQRFETYAHRLQDFPECEDPECFPRHRAEAAVFAARRDMDSAQRTVERAKKEIIEANPEIRPNIQAELDWLDAILLGPAPWH